MTFDLHLHRRKKEKRYWVAFKVKNTEEEVEDEESETDEHMAMNTKHFKKFLKNNQKGRNTKLQSQQKKFFNNSMLNSSSSMEMTQNHIQCREREGYGHIASDCSNVLKKIHTKKATNITWSEEDEKESNFDEEDWTANDQVTSFCVYLQFDSHSLQLLPVNTNSMVKDIARPNCICSNCTILKGNMEIEPKKKKKKEL